MLLDRAAGPLAPETGAPGGRGGQPAPRCPGRAFARPAWRAAGIGGAAVLGYEVFWTRLLSLPMRSFSYSFSLMLSLFLLGPGSGRPAVWDLARPSAARSRRASLGWIQLAMGAYVAAVAVLAARPAAARGRPSSFAGFLVRSALRASLDRASADDPLGNGVAAGGPRLRPAGATPRGPRRRAGSTRSTRRAPSPARCSRAWSCCPRLGAPGLAGAARRVQRRARDAVRSRRCAGRRWRSRWPLPSPSPAPRLAIAGNETVRRGLPARQPRRRQDRRAALLPRGRHRHRRHRAQGVRLPRPRRQEPDHQRRRHVGHGQAGLALHGGRGPPAGTVRARAARGAMHVGVGTGITLGAVASHSAAADRSPRPS